LVGLRAEHQEHTVGNLIGPGQVGEERPRGTQLAVDMVQPVNEDDRPAPAGSVFLSEEGKLSVEPIEQQFALARQVGSLGRDAGLLKGQAYIVDVTDASWRTTKFSSGGVLKRKPTKNSIQAAVCCSRWFGGFAGAQRSEYRPRSRLRGPSIESSVPSTFD